LNGDGLAFSEGLTFDMDFLPGDFVAWLLEAPLVADL